MSKQLRWSSVRPVVKEDNIMSSTARELHESGFIPTYYKEKTENMKYIMTFEYRRLWFEERAKYEKEKYTIRQIIKEENKIKRRFVQRMMNYRRPIKEEFAEESLAKNPIDNTKQLQEHQKYKPLCQKSKQRKPVENKNVSNTLPIKPKSKLKINSNKLETLSEKQPETNQNKSQNDCEET